MGLFMKCQLRIDSSRACFTWPEAELTAGFALRWRVNEKPAEIDTTASRPKQTTSGPIQPVPFSFPGLSDGKIIGISHAEGPISATWELFSPLEGTACAARLRVKNISDQPIELEALTPVKAMGARSLCLADSSPADWIVMRQPRHKNDMPACARPGGCGADLRDAQKGLSESGGILSEKADKIPPPIIVGSEMLLIQSGIGTGLPCLLTGCLPLTEQLVSLTVALDDKRRELDRLEATCLFDAIEMAPGQECESQWIWMDSSNSAEALIDNYIQAIRAWHPLRPLRRPTVWCSWYFYGDAFSFRELEDNLRVMESRKLPLDIVQIDMCWDRHYGDWQANGRWPQDMKQVTERIRSAGYIPGIWTAPFLVDLRTELFFSKRAWLLKNKQGELVFWHCLGMFAVLDPTHPEVLVFLEDLFRRMTQEWGFVYHKTDFSRAVADQPQIRYHDRSVTRAQAYRLGIEAIRRGIGPDGYLLVCGGLYGPSIGLADAHRTGSDVRSQWPKPPSGEEGPYGPFAIKQNTMRYWMNSLWDNDPDALMTRRRDEEYANTYGLSLGSLNDEEALTSALNQYLGGGIVCFSENLTEVDEDRLLLLRHCGPSIGCAAIPRDAFSGNRFPEVFHTVVQPLAQSMGIWHTLAVVNWTDKPRMFSLRLGEETLGYRAGRTDTFVAADFRTGTVWADLRIGHTISVGPVAPHGCALVKIAPDDPGRAQAAWTDGHFSMGGREITDWNQGKNGIEFTVDWKWACPLRVKLISPRGTRFIDGDTVVIEGPLQQPLTISRSWR